MITVILFSVEERWATTWSSIWPGLQGCNPDPERSRRAGRVHRNRWQPVSGTSPLPQLRPPHLLCGHHAHHLRLQRLRPDVHDHAGRPGHCYHLTLVYYIYNAGLRQYPRNTATQVPFDGAVRTAGADRYHHPVPRLQRANREGGRNRGSLLSRPRPSEAPQFISSFTIYFFLHRLSQLSMLLPFCGCCPSSFC